MFALAGWKILQNTFWLYGRTACTWCPLPRIWLVFKNWFSPNFDNSFHWQKNTRNNKILFPADKKLISTFWICSSWRINYFHIISWLLLKVQSCKSCNNKYMVASTQITNTEIFAFIAVIVLKLLSRNFLLINRKDNSNC